MRQPIDSVALGTEAYALVKELYPICRSITGAGVRDTLTILERFLPLERSSVPTGTRVFDWEIPREWNIVDAYIQDADGRRVIDFKQSNLHVVNYSVPVRERMTRAQLLPHLHTDPRNPDWIPYRTSYYRDSWGFCLSQNQLARLPDGEYDVCIDATLAPGDLTYAELSIPGADTDEIVVFTHICHPSLCNDNLSGIAVSTLLARSVFASAPHHFSYRFIFAPATIGSIAWLSRNESRVDRIRHGLVLASLGDCGSLTYKRSRRGAADVDRVVDYVLTRRGAGRSENFSPYGYDERQFCSPGFDLPFGRLTRTPNGRYPEYHTSADNLSFVSAESLGDSLSACVEVIRTLEKNGRYLNLSPKCEPRLGPRGLLRTCGGRSPSDAEHAILWVLNQSDGGSDLLSIAVKANMDFDAIADAAHALDQAGLLRRLGHGD